MMIYKTGHERRRIKIDRRGYTMEPFADVHWLVAGDVVSATAIYTDTGNGPPCTTTAIAHGKVGFDLHNSDNKATVSIPLILAGEVQKMRRTKDDSTIWVEAAIRLAFMALVEKLEAPSRLTSAAVHPWIAEGQANCAEIAKKNESKA